MSSDDFYNFDDHLLPLWFMEALIVWFYLMLCGYCCCGWGNKRWDIAGGVVSHFHDKIGDDDT
jgi:hypothetical protein